MKFFYKIIKDTVIKPKTYSITGYAHLRRARWCLDTNEKKHLFYTAFELRAGIESRMQEYLHSREEVSEKCKKEWQISKLGKSIEKALKITDRVAIIKIKEENGAPIITLRYVPVSKQLQNMGERLGDLLHAQRQSIPDDDPWWSQTRAFLEKVYTQLEKACSGTIMAPPLMNRKTKIFSILISQEREIIPKNAAKKMTKIGSNALVDISYEPLT